MKILLCILALSLGCFVGCEPKSPEQIKIEQRDQREFLKAWREKVLSCDHDFGLHGCTRVFCNKCGTKQSELPSL